MFFLKPLKPLVGMARPKIFELQKWSTSIDRHLTQLQKELALVRLSGGMYYCPKEVIFGQVPPEDKVLIRTFLKDKRFLLMAPLPGFIQTKRPTEVRDKAFSFMEDSKWDD